MKASGFKNTTVLILQETWMRWGRLISMTSASFRFVSVRADEFQMPPLVIVEFKILRESSSNLGKEYILLAICWQDSCNIWIILLDLDLTCKYLARFWIQLASTLQDYQLIHLAGFLQDFEFFHIFYQVTWLHSAELKE